MSKSGLLLIDKPSGWTSHDVVAKVRRILKTKAVGHSGTLDPFATGLMVLVVGQATKLSDYLRDSDKSYYLKAKWGAETDSLDLTGEITQTTDKKVDPELAHQCILAAQGGLQLDIPIFSAKKVNGKKLCDYAREGKAVEIPKKTMSFYGVEVEKIGTAEFSAKVSCKTGGFIRSWAKHIGVETGYLAHLTELRRLECCGYSVDQALTLEKLEESMSDADDLVNLKCFVPLSQTLTHWKTVTVKGKDADLLKNGQVSYDLARRLMTEQKQAQVLGESIPVKVLNGLGGGLLSILEARPQAKLKIRKVFDLAPH